MTIDPESPRPPSNAPPESQTPADFAAVQKRIAGWTLNGLATALVLVLGLAVGRQVMQWWAEDAPAPSGSSPTTPLPPAVSRVTLGNRSTFALRHFSGEHAAALATLCELCGQFGGTAPPPSQPPNQGEQKLLAEIIDKQPDQVVEGCRVDQMTGMAPMVVATREFARGPKPLRVERRVVALGLAMPVVANEWSLYVFPPTGVEGPAGGADLLPLPPGSKQTLALEPDAGRLIVAFAGGGELPEWRRFFQQEQLRRGWTVERDWEEAEAGLRAVFSISTPDRRRLELKLSAPPTGRLQGFAVITPLREASRP